MRAEINLKHGDCLQAMKAMQDNAFDLAIVDPPYRDENQPTKDMRASGQMKTIQGRPSKEYWTELLRVSKNQIIWGANNFELPQFKGFFVWDKGIPFDFTMSMAEIAALSEGLGTISKIYKLRVAGAEDRIHPTQKPVKLYKMLLDTYAKADWKILDTHLGSGSIAVACWDLKFDLTAYEIDKEYYDNACKRFDLHSRQMALW